VEKVVNLTRPWLAKKYCSFVVLDNIGRKMEAAPGPEHYRNIFRSTLHALPLP
jgi:hypothetical protein